MFVFWTLLWCTAVHLPKVSAQKNESEGTNHTQDGRRPIWNIAHMVNSLYEVDSFLDQGANSLEFDVYYDTNYNDLKTYHGMPCDCFRICEYSESFVTYIQYLHNLTTPGHPKYTEGLVLLFMDMKLNGLSAEDLKSAGEDFAMKLIEHYWERGTSGPEAYILISVPSIKHMPFIESFIQKLKSENFTECDSKIGFDFSENEDLNEINDACNASIHINQNMWQGDGITNCLPRGTARLSDAIHRRDNAAYMEKVYWWTVDYPHTMRSTLRLGVDGIITNHPYRLTGVLEESEFSSTLRLATHNDNPWAKFSQAETIAPMKALDTNITDSLGEDELLYNSEEFLPTASTGSKQLLRTSWLRENQDSVPEMKTTSQD